MPILPVCVRCMIMDPACNVSILVRWLLVLVFAPSIAGCVMPLDLGAASTPRSDDAIYLPVHRVRLGWRYPTFRAAALIQPPRVGNRPMVPIEPTDQWRVTHVVPDGYFIESKSYTKRLCAAYPRGHQWDEWGDEQLCASDEYLLHAIRWKLAISIRKDGSILEGWQLLDRQLGENGFWHETNRASMGWPAGIVIVPTTK